MALINFYKGLKENYSPDTHGNSIYSCTDTNECYILGVLYENISEEEITNKIGTNTYTDANYISKETNLTDAAMQLDEEIKATNDNIDILNAATVKSVKVGSNTSNEAFSSGVITIANATESSDGALSKEVYNSLSSFSYITSFGSAEESTSNLNYPIRLRNIANGTTSGNYLTIPVATTSNIGLMSKTDKTKLDNIESIYAKLTGDSFKNNNACWGGTKTTGETICLVFVDPNNNVKVGSPTTGLYLRSSSEVIYHEVQDGEDSQFHQILDEGNFKAGTNYVAPATLDEYTKSLVFTLSESANEVNAANYTKVLAGNHNISLNVSSGNYSIPNSIQTGTSGQIVMTYVTFTETGYQSVKWTVLADGTCTKELIYSFTIPSVNVVSEFPTELDNYADGSIFIKE